MKTYKLISSVLFFLHLCSYAVNTSGSVIIKHAQPAVNGTVYLNLDKATLGVGYIDIPLTFTSPDQITSLDVALQFDTTVLHYQKLVAPAPYLQDTLSNYSQLDHKLRITTNASVPYQANSNIISLRFTMLTAVVRNSDFSDLRGLLNGDVVPMQIAGSSIFPKYIIEPSTGTCNDPSFCLPITAIGTVENCIGYDLVLNYDPAKVHATGRIFINTAFIDSSYVSYVVNNNVAGGVINISVYLNTKAPANAGFNGIGRLLCVEFTKTPAFSAPDTATFTVPFLQESYVYDVSSFVVIPNNFINTKSTFYNSALKFWKDNSPIKYNSANPNQYLITNIYGADPNCIKSVAAVQPDTLGKFTYNTVNGSFIQIERDILPATNVQTVINGLDVNLAYRVVLDDLSFIPNIYQIIALDVNTDGILSAGDISQINQRSVKTIFEFKQKWNYNNNGTSNGQASKDWLFVDSSLLAGPAYKISAIYPLNDHIGFSKAKVPVVPFCLALHTSSSTTCLAGTQPAYTGILLGDANGNYEAIAADGQLKRLPDVIANGTIYLNLDQAKTGLGYIDVPVSFESTDEIVALDLSAQFNEQVLSFDKVVSTVSYLRDAMANVATDDRQLRFTSNSAQKMEAGKSIVYLRFSSLTGVVNRSDFSDLTGYLNGDRAHIELKGAIATGILAPSANTPVLAYPNPANQLITVVSPENVTVELMDLQGKQVMISTQVKANEKQQINVEKIATGTYLLKAYNENMISTQQLLIENKK